MPQKGIPKGDIPEVLSTDLRALEDEDAEEFRQHRAGEAHEHERERVAMGALPFGDPSEDGSTRLMIPIREQHREDCRLDEKPGIRFALAAARPAAKGEGSGRGGKAGCVIGDE
jgi:hypothetical protein